MSIDWSDPNPVFFDFETQSAADLKAVGGRLYAADPSTRILCATFLIDGVFHLWIPSHIVVKKLPDLAHVWPAQLGAPQPMKLHYGNYPPLAVMAAAEADFTFIAHNCLGFDRFIWERCVSSKYVPPWADSIPVARGVGLPGNLDRVASELVSIGKDNGKRILHKHIFAEAGENGITYTNPGAGDLEVILRYNLADVELLARAWKALENAPVEADVLDAHYAINERGVCVDTKLAGQLVALSNHSVGKAAAKIKELTSGELHGGNLRSTKQVNAWLDSKGVRILSNAVDDSGQRKRTLRKDFISQALANPWVMLDDDAPVAAVKDIDPAVFEVLRLRSAALRITGAKGERALDRTSPDGRARDVHTYHTAHTGRFSSAGIQTHNLPRPKKGVPVEKLLNYLTSIEGIDAGNVGTIYDTIAGLVPNGNVDDALSSLSRPLLYPAKGYAFGIVDYSTIEARFLAWLADEQSLLHQFASGVDVYKLMAARIYGIAVDAVDDQQRQVGKVTVLGCGYGMGDTKFALYAGLMGIDLVANGTNAVACVEAFRSAYPNIAGTPAGNIDGKPYRSGGIWTKLGRAAMDAVVQGGIHSACKTRWAFDGFTLRCELPSGRVLHYRHARVEDRIPGYALALGLDRPKATLIFESPLGERALYGAKLTENVDQAGSRDIMATALVNLERASFRTVLHVHDEIITELPDSDHTLVETQAKIMAKPPAWCAECPVAVEGFAAPRYLKGPPDGWPAKFVIRGDSY